MKNRPYNLSKKEISQLYEILQKLMNSGIPSSSEKQELQNALNVLDIRQKPKKILRKR